MMMFFVTYTATTKIYTCPHTLTLHDALPISGLTVAYHRKPVLWNVDFTAPSGGRVAIVGPNGAGKSTFIKAVLGLIPRLSGDVRVFGGRIDRQRRLIGYVPQRESVDWDFPTSAVDWAALGLSGRPGWCRPVRD